MLDTNAKMHKQIVIEQNTCNHKALFLTWLRNKNTLYILVYK